MRIRIPGILAALALYGAVAQTAAQAAPAATRVAPRQGAAPRPAPARPITARPVAARPKAPKPVVPASAAPVPAQPVAAAPALPPVVPPPVAQPDITPISVIIRAKARGTVRAFYEARQFRPLWAASGAIGPEAETFAGFLASADLDGLKPKTYKFKDVRRAVTKAKSGKPRDIADAELRLSQALAIYGRDLRALTRVEMTWADARLSPARPDDATVLRAAALPQPFARYISEMGWMNPHYLRLRGQLARARQEKAAEPVMARLRLNLERARVLPGAWTHHVVVDAGSARMWFYQGGQVAGTMKVVAGRPETPTPMMAGMLHYAILNPYWNVPADFARHSIAPKILSGRTLQSMGMEALTDWSARPKRLAPARINWRNVASGSQELRLRQLPGPGNSMGMVKFMFPNELGIYLHDTPDKSLFAENGRHFSNGCIRLEDAAQFGRWLLGKPVRAIGRSPEQIVPLPVPVPIYVTYFTIGDEAEPGSAPALIDDVYGRDASPAAPSAAALKAS